MPSRELIYIYKMVDLRTILMYSEDVFWNYYDMIKQAKPDLSHEQIIELVEKKLRELYGE